MFAKFINFYGKNFPQNYVNFQNIYPCGSEQGSKTEIKKVVMNFSAKKKTCLWFCCQQRSKWMHIRPLWAKTSLKSVVYSIGFTCIHEYLNMET